MGKPNFSEEFKRDAVVSVFRTFGTRGLGEAWRLWSNLGLIMLLVFDVASGGFGLSVS